MLRKVLVLHASFDGQTKRIAERIGAVLTGAGHAVTVLAADAPGAASAIAAHDAVVVGGAIRIGRHAPRLRKLVRAHATALASRPNAFFSVCLSAGGPGAKQETASGYIDAFCRWTGWQPHETASFAGALRYRKYNPPLRFMMRFIARVAGGDTDTSRDYEYTDWAAVDRFAVKFRSTLELPRAA